MANDFIRPERTAPDDVEQDPETGETVRLVEHYRQGTRRYCIIWEPPEWEGRVEDEDEDEQS